MKSNLKKDIKKIQTWSIDDLVEEKLFSKKEIYQKLAEEDQKYYIEVLPEAKKEAIASKKHGGSNYHTFAGLTRDELVELSIDELLEKALENDKKRDEQILSKIPDEIKFEKERYKGITDQELDEYVDLLVQRQILEDRINLRRAEVDLKQLENHPRSYKGHLALHDTLATYYVHNIESLDSSLEEIKESRKKSLGSFVKSSLIFAGSTTALLTVLGTLAGSTLLGLLTGFAVPAAVIGFLGAICGIPLLKDALHNKKVVEKLHETGLYDMFVEVAGLDKEIDEFEISKGMR